jgi:hypothetical protein
VEKSDYLDLDIEAAAMPIGMTRSIHSQFIDDSDVAGAAGAVAAGAVGTVTFCLSESILTPVTDGSVTLFVMFSKPVIRRVGKVTPLRKFCVPLTDITIYEELITTGASRMFVAS